MLLEPFDRDYFKALIILLPGFLTLKVSSYLAGVTGMNELELTMASLAYSLINFITATIIYFFFRWVFRRPKSPMSWPISVPFLLLLIAVSIGMGRFNALLEERGTLYILARTARTSSERPWVTAFRNNAVFWKSFVKVTLTSGLVYGGWPESASESEDNELFIRPAYLVRSNEKSRKIEGEGIVVFGRDIASVEFMKEHPQKWGSK